MSKFRTALLPLILLLLITAPAARAEEPNAEMLAKRVGQVFAGFDDFWVWVTQTFRDADKTERTYRGRAYFKRPRMFRLNFGQPPFLVHGTDGDEYWIYDAGKNTIEYTELDENTPVHVLFQVFAAGSQMVDALDRFFDVDELDNAAEYVDPKTQKVFPVHKLVISLKPERLEEMREREGSLTDAKKKQQWTFFVDKKTFLPRRIQVDWGTGERYVFDLGKFNINRNLDPLNFRRPSPPNVTVTTMKTDE